VEAFPVAGGVGQDDADAVGGAPVELEGGVEPGEEVFGHVAAALRHHP
jgi:hypothetical protein